MSNRIRGGVTKDAKILKIGRSLKDLIKQYPSESTWREVSANG